MDTLTLWNLALSNFHIRKKFGGVFSSDDLPEKKGKHKSFIINLDKKNQPGSHWISIYFEKDLCMHFCSFGSKPEGDILDFIQRNSRAMHWNKIRYQSFFTTTCGLFCLYFIYKMNRKEDLSTLSICNREVNEKIIQNFAKVELHNINKVAHVECIQVCCANHNRLF